MRASFPARRRWRSVAVLALPGLVMVVADRTQAAPPPDEPPPSSVNATELAPDPPTTGAPPPEPPSTEAPTTVGETTPTSAELPDGTFTAEQLTPSGRETGTRAPTSQLAETSPGLVGRTDATPIEVLVKLDYDSIATYAGGVDGLAPTSPAVTGQELTGVSQAEQAYEGYVVDQESAFLGDLAAVAPDALVGQSLRTVYGGVAVTLPADKVDDVLAIDGVVAVQEDALLQPLTDSSPDFIGADSLYPALGGDTRAGSGVIFGVLDSGAWPEHQSFADQGVLSAPPRTFDGRPRACDFGDNPLTPAADPFVCNDKLIGGRPFLATYLSNPARRAAEPFKTARDSNGHGTHTGSTAAGNVLGSAPIFGVERGPINGIAPGAWVSVYKVCGIQGCYSSDSAAAVQQAIRDGVDVINFSISGGTNPATDPVELAFLDAYAAGVFVAASAGNDGPGAGTANHLSPWTTTVAASTQTREFQSTLTVTGTGGATATFVGASITAGAGPLPVVLSSAPPYSNMLCNAPAPPGTFTGKIVACQRGGNARVEKGYNVLQGGAAGMILYNPTLADIETDNHWLPTVHLANGTDFLAFVNANPGATAEFTAGAAKDGQGDVMAAFSSRGPAGLFVKPDVTAPGVQILAGHTPFRESILGGPPGEYFQAIAGTSMSSPHVAGSAILLAALRPDWTPGQLKSALMTTATTDVVKEDLTTPADPFDLGGGRVDLAVAGNPGLTFDASAADMYDFGTDPVTSVHLNLPSVNAPLMPGRLTTRRVATNVSGRRLRYDVEATAPDGSSITVSPRKLNLGPGQSGELDITIESTAVTDPPTQYFGKIRLVPRTGGYPELHMPVAFVPVQGAVNLASECDPTEIARGTDTRCTITATNTAFTPTTVDLTTYVNGNLQLRQAIGADLFEGRARLRAELAGGQAGVPSVDPGELFGYVPLSMFGVTPDPIGDEEIINYDVPQFVYNGVTYTSVGVDSNGYLVAGGGTAEDNECCTLPDGPDPARPNNMLAPFWTDLNGTGAPGIRAAVLEDGPDAWLVVEWQVNVFGTTSRRTFQTWIGITGEQDITYAYAAPQTDPAGQDFLVGAENAIGEGDMETVLPTADLRVTSSDLVPGGSASYVVVARGVRVGEGVVTTEMVASGIPGVTVVRSTVNVTRN